MNRDGRSNTRYITGETMCVGDLVRLYHGGDVEHVEMVFEPGTEQAKDFCCPNGGVRVVPTCMIVQIGSYDWEDLEFVSRADGTRPGRTKDEQ